MKIKVEITETLQRVVEVEATNEKDAIDLVKALYNDEYIVLDYNDFVGNDFEVYKEE